MSRLPEWLQEAIGLGAIGLGAMVVLIVSIVIAAKALTP